MLAKRCFLANDAASSPLHHSRCGKVRPSLSLHAGFSPGWP